LALALDELGFEIHGSKGALRFITVAPHHLEVYDAQASDQPLGGQRYARPAGFPGPKFGIGWIRTHMACLAQFLVSVAEGTPADPGLEQGIYVQRLIQCARTWAQAQSWVEV
jgi:predicted dehydrogenase